MGHVLGDRPKKTTSIVFGKKAKRILNPPQVKSKASEKGTISGVVCFQKDVIGRWEKIFFDFGASSPMLIRAEGEPEKRDAT